MTAISFVFGRCALFSCVAASILTACGGSQPAIRAPGAMPQTSTIAARAERGKSWMLPEAKGDDLLYASESIRNKVFILTYPRGKLVGTLTGFNMPFGDCVDSVGDVWIINQHPPEVIEYAHGGTTPIATLTTDAGPYACAIDLTTGNLAVTYDRGEISVFLNAQGPPTNYMASNFNFLQYGGYDPKGDFFAFGDYGTEFSGEGELAELPKGSKSIIPVLLNQHIYADEVQWDGKYLAIGGNGYPDQPVPVYQVNVSGSQATVVNTVELEDSHETRVRQQFWIQGNRIIQGFDHVRDLGIWRYPQGGSPASTIKHFAGHRIWGVVVSVAPSQTRTRK